MPALLGAADAGLHALADVPLFRYGVSPNKIFDYMAAGLPVLTNTPGEMTELVERTRSGVAVAPSQIARGVDLLVSADLSSGPDGGMRGARSCARGLRGRQWQHG